MRVCWDAEVGERAPCGALSGQDSWFLPISRMITGLSDATRRAVSPAVAAPPWGARERPYQNASEERWTRLCRLRAGRRPLAAAVGGLDGHAQAERVGQRDRRRADEPRLAVGGAETREVEDALRAAAPEGLARHHGAVADDLGARTDALALRARDGRGEGDVTTGPEETERKRTLPAGRERPAAHDDQRLGRCRRERRGRLPAEL